MGSDAPETVAAIVAAHRAATMTPAQTVARSYQRIRAHNDPAIFISLRDEKEALAEAEALASKDAAALPLFGVPVAVKDNIDVAGLPTTAACPEFAYPHTKDVLNRRRQACRGGRHCYRQDQSGSVCDRLVGQQISLWRPRNALRDDLIPGGSSSGSAVAVAAGIVDFSLGTDTAGSGRIPAGDEKRHRRPEAYTWADLQRRTRSGLPDAGLHFGVLAHRRRCDDRAGGDGGS